MPGSPLPAVTPVEHIRVETEDGLLLDGHLYRSEAGNSGSLAVDCAILVHGTGSDFLAPGLLEFLAHSLTAAGCAVMRVNTRGHGIISRLASSTGSRTGGAAYETVAEAHRDLAAWTQLAAQLDFKRLALVGHSMGGVKSTLSLATQSLPAVTRLICLGSPRFCHAELSSHPSAEPFRADYARALELVQAGRGDELIHVRQPLPLIITAGNFLEKYGPDDRYDLIRLLPHVGQPALIVIGGAEVERSGAYASQPAALTEQRQSRPATAPLEFAVVPGARTPFHGYEQEVAGRVLQWLAQ